MAASRQSGAGLGAEDLQRSHETPLRRGIRFLLRGGLLASLLAAPMARGEDESPVTRLFDTGAASAQPLAPDSLAKLAGARQIPEDQTNVSFSGDAVLLNDKLAVVFRKLGKGPEVYAKTEGGLKLRAELGHAPELPPFSDQPPDFFWAWDPAGPLKVLENTAGGVVLEMKFEGPVAAALCFRLTAGEATLEIRSPDGHGFVDWWSDYRFLVIADFFGDDMVYTARGPSPLCLPTENLCLHLIEGGEAMIMGVWRSSDQQVWTAAPYPKIGQPATTPVPRTLVRCLKDQSLWLAFIESPRLWQTLPEPAKITPPFPAKWRASFARGALVEDPIADSWDLERGPSPEQRSAKPRGPGVVYPIDRNPTTPLTATCPTDVMRNTLGVGPCQYILACEGMGAQGDPTPNSVMTWVEKQFEQKKEKKVADDIKERLDVMVKHVAEARARIERYRDFAAKVRKITDSAPQMSAYGSTHRPIVDELEQSSATALGPESSPATAQEIEGQVMALIGQGDAPAGCRRAGERLRALGAIQDGALARCRMAVRRLKAQALNIDWFERIRFPDTPRRAASDASLAREIARLAESTLKTESNPK